MPDHTDRPVKVGIIGCGNISDVYLSVMQGFEILEVAACADRHPERAEAKAAQYNVPRAYNVEQLLADPEIEIAVNLTSPLSHAPVALAALQAGKSVYNEKPLAITREEALEMLDLARQQGLRVGGAPDTFLGAGLQTCRQLIDEGTIGGLVGATAFVGHPGPESWHPNPEFFYKVGAGPLFDVGPYYLTALVALLGPARRVTGSARISFPERTIASQPKAGTRINVEVPTHVAGVIDFASGPVATLVASFDVTSALSPLLEIYGSKGTLTAPDPNTFGGPVYLQKPGESTRHEVPLTHGYAENSRGLGVADMAYALRRGRPQRAGGELAYHVLDIMHAIHDASQEGKHIEVASSCERPAPLPPGPLNA